MLNYRVFGILARSRAAWLLLALPLWFACSNQEAAILVVRAPAGITIKTYSVDVQDRPGRDHDQDLLGRRPGPPQPQGDLPLRRAQAGRGARRLPEPPAHRPQVRAARHLPGP